jgi:riboflavin biosynthesis pyrimidine reductase
MRALRPVTTGSDDVTDLHSFYAQDWVERGGVRANFVSSVDGAISAQGTSGGLQTPGDNRVFAALRDLADVVLVGAGTASAEKYGPVRPSAAALQERRDRGFSDTLPIALVSRSLHLDPTSDLFEGSDARARPIVLTCDGADASARAALSRVADVVNCGASSVDLTRALTALRERGLTRILCEGGPSLFASLADEGLIDELCLSISPVLAGPGSGRVSAGEAWGTTRALRLRSLLEEDGALFCRYTITEPS